MEAIRKKYAAPEKTSDKLAQLKRLDKQAEFSSTLIAVCVGIVGTLFLGAGLSLILKTQFFLIGLLLGILGLCVMAVALPVFRKVAEIRRKQIAPEILRLIEEIEKGI